MKITSELAKASDEEIEDAVALADPLALRGLLYQLTEDEALAGMPIAAQAFGYSQMDALVNADDVALIREKTVAWLKKLRNDPTGEVDIGDYDRLPRSLEFIAGQVIAESELELWTEETGLDPFARGLKWKKEPTVEEKNRFFVVVVGAGLSGINAAVHLKTAGIPFIVLEKNSDVGGTWHENRYPGIRVDSPTRGYLHLFGLEFRQPYSFCPGAENVRYMKWIVEKFDLFDNFVFDTEVAKMVWDEDHQKWHVNANGPDGQRDWNANAVISCVGFLSRPLVSPIPGLDLFEGIACHSARWPEDLDVTGKRVAIIGSGASGYQMSPVIAKAASQTYLFQRTPSWCYPTPSYVTPLPKELLWAERNIPFYVNFGRFQVGRMYGPDNSMKSQRIDPQFNDPHTRSATNRAMREGCLEFIRKTLASRPDLIEKMTPRTPPMTSRPIRIDPEDNVYTALLQENFELVSDPIERITPTGIEVGGRHLPVDVIVLATGFRANDFLFPMEIRGRDDASVKQLWGKDGPRAYVGSMLPGFPNFFMAYGPNTNNFGGLQVIDLLEIEIRFALQCIAGLIEQDRKSVDVTSEGYWRFNEELDKEERKMIYMDPGVSNYYKNSYGRSSVNGPIDIRRMWHWLRNPTGTPPEAFDAGVKPFFGADLVVR